MLSEEAELQLECFNSNLKILTSNLSVRFPNDATIARAKSRIMLAINESPLYVIGVVGPYLFKYRDQIYNLDEGAESFFLDNPFDAELKAGVDSDKVDMVGYIIPKMKECTRSLPAAEKEQYKQLVVGLLDSYLEYLAETHSGKLQKL